jgi:Uri superfamily endonuclease
MMLSIPSKLGSYALQLNLVDTQDLRIGRLGKYEFPAGEYIYLGSALGSGGLQARLGRHLRGVRRLHWHIDWLRSKAVVSGYYFLVSDDRLECLWSQALIAHLSAGVPVPGFGASDCRGNQYPCSAHLVWLKDDGYREKIQLILSKASGSQVRYRKFTSDSQLQAGYIE